MVSGVLEFFGNNRYIRQKTYSKNNHGNRQKIKPAYVYTIHEYLIYTRGEKKLQSINRQKDELIFGVETVT